MPSMTLTCAVCNLPMQKSRTSRPQGEAVHNKCRHGEDFVRGPVGLHGVSGYRRGCRCETCRLGQNASMREYAKKRKAADGIGPTSQYERAKRGVDPLAVVNCAACSEPLENVRTNRACYPLHKACRASAPEWMRRGWDKPTSSKVAAFQRKLDKAARGTSGGKRVFTAGPCPWCGEQFVRAQARWCSAKCKTSARFAAKSSIAFKISPRKRAAIYERDGWTCQLCSYPVDRSLHYLDDWSATLDHIIPQSHQIVPDHSPDALRLAHRWCNGARGDGSNMTEADFLARVAVRYQGALAA